MQYNNTLWCSPASNSRLQQPKTNNKHCKTTICEMAAILDFHKQYETNKFNTPNPQQCPDRCPYGTHTDIPTPPPSCKVEKVKRPSISAGCSSEEWSYFTTRWQEYVEVTKILGKESIIQLLECCDENVHNDLTRTAVGSLVAQGALTASKQV